MTKCNGSVKFFLSLFFSLLLITSAVYAQQPPGQTLLSMQLLEKLHGPAAFKARLEARKVDRKLAQTKGVAKPVPAATKCNPSCDALLAKARQKDSINVIILFHVPNLPGYAGVPKEKLQVVHQERERAIGQVQERFIQRMRSHKIHIGAKFKLTPGMGITVDAAALLELIRDPEIKSIGEDIPSFPQLPQSAPLIGADQTWANGFTGAGYTIAILDTGVDSSHVFLAGEAFWRQGRLPPPRVCCL